jgi:anti-sigma-K factor RskA
VKLLRHDLHTLTGVYALDAIEGSERDRFERHLHRCQPCGNEVRGLRETAGRLAVAVAGVPPPQLKERVLAAAARTRQLPPLAADRPQSRAERLQSGTEPLPPGTERPPPGTERPPPGTERPPPTAGRTWLPRLAAAFGAAGLAAAIVLGFALSSTQRQLDSARAQDKAISAVLTAPGARILTARSSVGGTGTVIVAVRQQKLIFTATGLPPLSAAKVYQLWLMGPPRIRSAGLLPPPAQGRTPPLLAAGLRAGDQVGVTVEPAGGTSQPTTTPILVMPVR